MNEVMERSNFLKKIYHYQKINRLGLFLGSGFSKNVYESAMNWNELIDVVCEKLNVKLKEEWKGFSQPIKFSLICDEYAENNNIEYNQALSILKNTICILTDYYNIDINKYNNIFRVINPNWVVTTNYDTIIEKILCGRGLPLSIDDIFIQNNDAIPVYHIHGIRNIPKSIVATQEDYAKYLRFNNYAYNRLPLLFAENFVLIAGYSIRDINILQAIDCSNNIFNVNDKNKSEIVQLRHVKKNPKEKLYFKNGIWYLETVDMFDTFNEIMSYILSVKDDNKYDEQLELILDCNSELIDKYIENADGTREKVNNLIMSNEFVHSSYYAYFFRFINEIINRIDNESVKPNNFHAYCVKLQILLNLMNKINFEITPEVLVDFIIQQLEYVSYYVGYELGKSWDAKTFWDNNKNNLNKKNIEYIYNKIMKRNENRYDYSFLIKLLKEVVEL